MNPKIKLNIKSLTEESLLKKFSIAFIFMTLVPLVLTVFIIHILRITPLLERQLPYFRLTILLVILLGLASFDLVRRSMSSLTRFAHSAKEISNGRYDKRVTTSEKNEIGLLENSFNKVTGELEAKIRELEESKELLQNILQKIGNAVTSSKGIDNLLELIIETLVKGTGSTAGAIFLLDGQRTHLTVKVSYGMAEATYMKDIRLRADKGLISRVIRFKKPETVSDVSNNAAAYFEFKNKLAKDSILVTPLICQKEVLGVITVSDKKKRDSFDADDIILLSNVAAQAAIAIKNFQLNEDAEQTYLETITALAIAVEAKDPYSRGHLERVARYVEILGKHLDLDDNIMKVLKSGAFLHDVGKIGIRDEVLGKEGPLTSEEEKDMMKHVNIGVNIIKPIRSMAALCDLVKHHQEHYDGTGYPDGLKGEEIPFIARILKICDAYDAMTTDRPYRKAMNKKKAKEELKQTSGTDFDPKIVEEFIKLV